MPDTATPDFLPYTPEEAAQFAPQSAVAPSTVSTPDTSDTASPDTLPYSPDDVKALMSDPWHTPSREQAQVLYDQQKNTPTGEAIKQVAGNIWPGLKALGQQFVDAHHEAKAIPLDANGIDRVFSTLFEAGAQGYHQDKAMVKGVFRPVISKIGEALTGADDQKKFEDYYQNLLASRKDALDAQNLPAERPQNFDPEQPRPFLSEDSYRDGGLFSSQPAPPATKTSQALSNLLSPIALSTAGIGDVIGAGGKVVAGKALEQVLKTEKGLAAAEKASAILDRVAAPITKVNEALSQVPAKSVEKVAGGIQALGKGAKMLGGAPEAISNFVIDRAVPAVAQDRVKKILDSIGFGGAAAGFAGEGGLAGSAMAKFKALQGIGWSTEQTADFVRRLAQLPGDSQVPRLFALSRDESAPLWLRAVSSSLNKSGIGQAFETAGDFAKSAVHGGAMAGVLGELSDQNPEEEGRFIGGGVGLGALGRLERKLSGADAQARAIQQRTGDLARLYLHLREQGVPDAVIEKIQTEPALMVSALQAATARGVFNNKLNFSFLDKDSYDKTLGPQGQQGTAAYFSPVDNKIFINIDSRRDATAHEISHAVARAVGADPEAHLTIDSIFTPEKLQDLRNQYAGLLVQGDLKQKNALDLRKTDPGAYQKLVADKVAQLDQAHGSDKWIYDEIYAESAYSGLLGKDLKSEVLDRSRFGWLGNKLRGDIFGAMGLKDSAKPVSRLFDSPEVYQNPALRKMVYEHLRKVNREGPSTAAKETKEGNPNPIPVAKDIYGKHPSVPLEPNPTTGRLENDAAVKNPATGEVTLRKPSEIRRIEKTRQAETKKAFEAVAPKPKNDTTPEVAPRTQPDGTTEISGTKFSDQLSKMPQFGEEARKTVANAEKAMGSGGVLDLWYQAIGTGAKWAGDVRRRLGNIAAAKVKITPFLFKVSKEGNVLVVGLSLTSFDRKLTKWLADEKLGLWNNDGEAFKADTLQYLKNHAENRPGEDSIGASKKNVINTFLLGYNKGFKDLNPLREHLKGEDKVGLIRSLRLDRIANAEIAPDAGWTPRYEKMVKNLSPDVPQDIQQAPSDNETQHLTSTDTNRLIHDVDEKGFFSAAVRAIDAKMPNKAPAAQIKAILRNPQSGVKADEIKWTGLDDFLNTKPTFTKDEVKQFLDANKIQIHEVVKGDKSKSTPVTPSDVANVEMVGDNYYVKFNDGATVDVRGFDADSEEQAIMNAVFDRNADLANETRNFSDNTETKFEQYVLPGGSNYRELLFTLPGKRHWLDGSPVTAEDLSTQHGRDAADRVASHENDVYKSSHFDEPNVLAHTRFNERTDADGKRLLHLEEIQSDWHQEGRKKGYKPETLKADEAKIVSLKARVEEMRKKPILEWSDAEKQEFNQVSGELYEEQTRQAGKRVEGVPDAPFKNSWHELVLKRMLRMAAEQGFDKLTWTTGEQQAERYDLSKQVRRVYYLPETSKLSAQGHDGSILIEETVPPEKVADYIGKDAAEKLFATPIREVWRDQNGALSGHDLSGLDLKVGGEGMKGFYDKILPDFLNKYGKKWGAKVGETTLVPEAASRISKRMSPAEKAEYLSSMKDKGGVFDVHSIDITPAMKKAVLNEGQAQFSPDTSKSESADEAGSNPKTKARAKKLWETLGTQSPFFQSWFRGSKVVDESKQPLPVFHGTGRPDRIGNRFLKSRATSGPMQYFTDDPAIASKYATGKQDTSLTDHDPQNHLSLGKAKGLNQIWYSLTPEQRQTITELAPRVGSVDETGEIVLKPEGNGIASKDTWDYTHKHEGKGNTLRTLYELWVNSGAIFGREEEFLDVLKAAGLSGVKYNDPHATYPAVYKVFLSVKNPLNTSAIPDAVVQALDSAARRSRAKAARYGADAWDKNTRDPKEWAAQLKQDRAEGKNSFVWSSIPDWATVTLKNLGYDGIQDTGGKMGGQGHNVWIPFEPSQIKTAIGSKGTFDPSTSRIDFSPDTEQKEAPVKFHSVQQGAPGIGWFLPTEPIKAPDGGNYYPHPEDRIKISSGQLRSWGMRIPPAEVEKFVQAGGDTRGKQFSPDSSAPTKKDYKAMAQARRSARVPIVAPKNQNN